MSHRPRGSLEQRQCELKSCGKLFPPTRRDQKFCDPQCKTQAWRERQAELQPPPSSEQPSSVGSSESGPQAAAGEAPIDEVLVRRLQWQRQQRGQPPVKVDPLLTVLAKVHAVQQLLRDPEIKAALTRYEATYDRAAGILTEAELAEAELGSSIEEAVTRLGLAVLKLEGRVSVVVFVARDEERAAG